MECERRADANGTCSYQERYLYCNLKLKIKFDLEDLLNYSIWNYFSILAAAGSATHRVFKKFGNIFLEKD
jgi:hypothetical protein